MQKLHLADRGEPAAQRGAGMRRRERGEIRPDRGRCGRQRRQTGRQTPGEEMRPVGVVGAAGRRGEREAGIGLGGFERGRAERGGGDRHLTRRSRTGRRGGEQGDGLGGRRIGRERIGRHGGQPARGNCGGARENCGRRENGALSRVPKATQTAHRAGALTQRRSEILAQAAFGRRQLESRAANRVRFAPRRAPSPLRLERQHVHTRHVADR